MFLILSELCSAKFFHEALPGHARMRATCGGLWTDENQPAALLRRERHDAG